LKTFDHDLEMRAVKSAVSSPKRMSLLRKAGGSSLFHFTASQEIFDRATYLMKTKGVAPTWRDIITDPAISEPVRERAAKVKSAPIKKIKTMKQVADRLGEYTRIRFAAEAAKSIAEAISEDSVSADDLSDILAKAAQKSRKVSDEETFRHIGDGKKLKRTGKDVLRDLMKRGGHNFVPTGLRAFDERSRGFIKTAFISLAGTTGGGKTTLADTIRVNQALNGARSCYWSLEMNHEEMENRLLARITDIPMERFQFPEKLKKSEKRKIVAAYDEYATRIIENGGFTSEAVPRGGVSMRDVLDQSEPFSYDTIFIDYMTLLEDADSEEQWKALGQAGRQAKVFAQANNCAVVLLAQLSEEEKIRYAKAIKEHAGLMWTWTFGEREKETHMVKIVQQKSRNQPMYDFFLRENFAMSRFEDPTEDQIREYKRSQTNVVGQRSSLSDYRKLKSGSGAYKGPTGRRYAA